MKNAFKAFWWVAIMAMCFATSAFAGTTVTLTSPGGYVYDGIYVSPYYATVGGVANTPIVCDDFTDESYTNSTWNASVTPFSNSMTNTAWTNAGKSAALYGAVGWLTQQVLAAPAGSTTQIIDTYALWAVFDPSGVESYLAGNPITTGSLTTAQLCDDIYGDKTGCTTSTPQLGGLLYTAENSNFTPGEFGMTVLSPYVSGSNSTVCNAESGNCPAQEFIAVPEGGAAAAYLLLAGLCCFGAMFFRCRRQNARIGTALS
jgi:hypothetical protein